MPPACISKGGNPPKSAKTGEIREFLVDFLSLKSKQKQIVEAKNLNHFISKFSEIKTLDSYSSKIYGEICAELDRSGMQVPQFDLLNASIAIANKAILIMKDKKHFPRINALSEFDFLELWE